MGIPQYHPNTNALDTNGQFIWATAIITASLSQKVLVSGTAIRTPTVPLGARKFLIIQNNSGDIIYIGDSTVTTSAGFPLYPRQAWTFYINDNIDLYCVSSGTNSDVRLMEGS